MKRILVNAAIATGALAAGVGFAYGLWIEPYKLAQNNVEIVMRRPLSGRYLTVAQISDVHLNNRLHEASLRHLVQAVNEAAPDIILNTGDVINRAGRFTQIQKAGEIFSELEAPLGKYCIWGNHDRVMGGHYAFLQVARRSGFEVLRNRRVDIPLEGGYTLRLIGIDDNYRGRPDYSMVTPVEPGMVQLVLVHDPNVVRHFAEVPFGLALAGHSHGGQVRLGPAGSIIASKGGREYVKGNYKLPRGLLHVDSGFGSSSIPVRFKNPPQYSILRLHY